MTDAKESPSSSELQLSPSRRLFSPFTRLFGGKREKPTLSEKVPETDPRLTIGQDAKDENKDRRRDVNSLPPWIHSLRKGENLDEAEAADPLLPVPSRIRPAEHNHTPVDPKSIARPKAGRGKQWNHARTREAVTMSRPTADHHSRWRTFADSSLYADHYTDPGHVVDDDWLEKNMPELDTPYETADMTDDELFGKGYWLFNPKKRSASYDRFQQALMRNAFVPLIVRMTVLVFSLSALGIGVQIFRESHRLNNSRILQSGTDTSGSTDPGSYICKQQTSTYMAFIVNIVAPIYILYITVDEYRSQPLGLRRTRSKLRLLFLDLVFIIFSAANLSLAFNTLTDQQWSCFVGNPADVNSNNDQAARSTCVYSTTLCHRQMGLVSVLTIAELAWVMTFAISVLRVVERVSR